jgi:hypothetical protein
LQQPDVIVVESGQGIDLYHGAIRMAEDNGAS